MADQIFLMTPDDALPATFPAKLAQALKAPLSVLLVSSSERADADYIALVTAIAPAAQAAGVAVLVDDRPDLVIPLGVDGVHMRGGIKAVREAIATLKPDHIVGAGDIGSRHEAMLRGELDIDYLLFGDRAESDAALADWWAETFEVPSVYLAAGLEDPAIPALRTEFLALGGSIWEAPDMPGALTDLLA